MGVDQSATAPAALTRTRRIDGSGTWSDHPNAQRHSLPWLSQVRHGSEDYRHRRKGFSARQAGRRAGQTGHSTGSETGAEETLTCPVTIRKANDPPNNTKGANSLEPIGL